MSPDRKGKTTLFVSKINKPVIPSLSAILPHGGAGVVRHAAEVRFVMGSSQPGMWIQEAWFTEHITGVIPASNYPHQWPMLGDCGFKAAPSAGAEDIYGRKIFKATGCWGKKTKKQNKQKKASRESWLLNATYIRIELPTNPMFLQDEVSNSKCFITMCSVIIEHRGAALAGMTGVAATQHGGGEHQQEVRSGWETFTFCLENWNRTLRCKNPLFKQKLSLKFTDSTHLAAHTVCWLIINHGFENDAGSQTSSSRLVLSRLKTPH